MKLVSNSVCCMLIIHHLLMTSVQLKNIMPLGLIASEHILSRKYVSLKPYSENKFEVNK